MKKLTLLLVLVIFISTSGFVIEKNRNNQDESVLEKIANAHGLENWKNVNQIRFTFNVDRDTTHFERSWVWKPKTSAITAITSEKTIEYNWADMDSTAYKTNGDFINDKYWLLAPFQLVWDGNNIKHEHIIDLEAPIAKKPMQKLTIVYGNEGGYTPGDAYDFYFGDDYIVQEWVFRKANQPEPSMITTFEDYEEVNGMKIAKMHKMGEGNFKLFFTGLEVITD